MFRPDRFLIAWFSISLREGMNKSSSADGPVDAVTKPVDAVTKPVDAVTKPVDAVTETVEADFERRGLSFLLSLREGIFLRCSHVPCDEGYPPAPPGRG